MAFDLKSLFKKPATPEAAPASTVNAAGNQSIPQASSRKPLPFIGHLPIELQFRLLGTLFLIGLLVTIAAIFLQSQASSRGAAYLSVSGQIRPLSQQIPRAAQNALEGQTEGFRELRDARGRFASLLDRLTTGGDNDGIMVSATDARRAQ